MMSFSRRHSSPQRRICSTRSVLLASLLLLVIWVNYEYTDDSFIQQPPYSSSAIPRLSHRPMVEQARSQPRTVQDLIVDCTEIDIDEPTKDDPTWIQTATRPSFYMHVHPLLEDNLSNELSKMGCYECDLLPHTIYALQSRPDTILIDIGANMGLYTLAAAAAGFEVVAFEPVLKSYRKVCESIHANPGFSDRITLIRRAVAHKRGIVGFRLWKHNYAGIATTQVEQPPADKKKNEVEQPPDDIKEGVHFARAVNLNDLEGRLLPTNRPVVLKVDVEGSECEAIAGALNYLEKVEIVYAQIELNPERSKERCDNIQEISDFFTKKGMKPYMMINGQRELDPSIAKEWKSPKPGGNFDVGWFPNKSI